MIELIGWLGAFCFSICAIPQAWLCYKQGHARGVSEFFLSLWFIGEVCMLIYSLTLPGAEPLIVNYLFNLACLLIIMKYKVLPKKDII